MSLSTGVDPVHSMRWELTGVGVQSVIFSVGLATFEYILNTSGAGDDFKNTVNWILLIVAIFKTCATYNLPKKAKKDRYAAVHDNALAQIMVDGAFWAGMSRLSEWMSQIQINLTEEEKLAHGKMINYGVSFCTALNYLIISRTVFLLFDFCVGGRLSRVVRIILCKEIEGLPLGKTNIHGD